MRPLNLPALTRRAVLVSAAALPVALAGPAAAAGNVAEEAARGIIFWPEFHYTLP